MWADPDHELTAFLTGLMMEGDLETPLLFCCDDVVGSGGREMSASARALSAWVAARRDGMVPH